jgi:hypothetical protein
MTDLARAVTGYARRLHAVIGSDHHVASPLGAWLVLALAARTSTGSVRQDLDEILGMDAEVAANLAGDLLAAPHPLVHAAASAWRGPAGRTPKIAAWLGSLPAAVQTGDVDDQATLDRWASEHTHGLIEEFPLQLKRLTMLVVASALATKVTWRSAFEVAPADQLGADRTWRVPQVLWAPEPEKGNGHEAAIVRTTTAGDVIVHVADAEAQRASLRVVSVAAAPEVPAGTVLDVAHEIAGTIGRGERLPDARSLFDLPLGDAPLWSIHESPVRVGRQERYSAYLPAWTARSEHDLLPPELGLAQAGLALGHRFGEGRPVVEAKQVALARYGRRGFQAAAVTALMMTRSASVGKVGRRRTAELRFAHPYAAVAVATGGGPWGGLPVFSAWVAEAAADVDAGVG